MTDRKSIEARIVELKGQLDSVEGTPTEVYSRIVGYYRSVRNWNAGKREEYSQRLAFDLPASLPLAKAPKSAASEKEPRAVANGSASKPAPAPAPVASMGAPDAASLRGGVLVFTREACPNCPPVVNYVVASGMKAVFVDADKDEGLALARERGVLATPTVLGLDEEGRESFRAFDVKTLRTKVSQAAQ
jgi:hypothetical protein